jgi:hypothetical protein
MSGVLQQFACPVFGRVREISPRALKLVERGERSGACRSGEGCRGKLPAEERMRRFWLHLAGVDELAIRGAGGALAYVARYGLPELLGEMAWSLSLLPLGEPPRVLVAA